MHLRRERTEACGPRQLGDGVIKALLPDMSGRTGDEVHHGLRHEKHHYRQLGHAVNDTASVRFRLYSQAEALQEKP